MLTRSTQSSPLETKRDIPQIPLLAAQKHPLLPLLGAKLAVLGLGVDDVFDGAPYEAGAAGDEDDCKLGSVRAGQGGREGGRAGDGMWEIGCWSGARAGLGGGEETK